MRDIKFRALDANGEMVFSDNHYMGDLGMFFEQMSPDAKDVMQYTGIKDRNGVEIYEGDILHTNYYKDNGWNTKSWHENQEVKFADGAFQLGDFSSLYECVSDPQYGLEVIGNIYANPELLK